MEAPRIRIPERYQPGIAKIISLTDNACAELLSILNETPHSFNLDSIKESTVSKIETIPESDFDEIMNSLDALYYINHQFDIPIQDFSEQVLQAMAETGKTELQIQASLREPLRDRLTRLMSGKLLSIAIKSRDILHEHERTFGSARVLSDIRTVYTDNLENTTDGAVIVHMLKIHYIQDDQHKEFFVALDTEDISFLTDTLIRAQEKEETLKAILAAANVPYIDAE
jgi:hypothetical protein